MSKEVSRIENKLITKDQFERRILNNYKDLLYSTFQIIYQVDAEIDWQRITRFSPESNFVMIGAVGVIPKGYDLNSNILTEDIVLSISFTIPWIMLDDGSTADQVSVAAHDLDTLNKISLAGDYIDFLRSSENTLKEVQEKISSISTPEPVTTPTKEAIVDHPQIVLDKNKKIENYPEFLKGFNTSDLTEEQKEKLLLASYGGNK